MLGSIANRVCLSVHPTSSHRRSKLSGIYCEPNSIADDASMDSPGWYMRHFVGDSLIRSFVLGMTSDGRTGGQCLHLRHRIGESQITAIALHASSTETLAT